MDRAARGDRVQVLCATRLDDETWLEDEQQRAEPFWLRAGQATKLQPVADALVGMTVGERKTVVIPPDQGFGRPDPEKVFQVSRVKLPRHVAVGDQLDIHLEQRLSSVRILELDAVNALVDANHPLAGRTMTIGLQVLSIAR